MLHCTLLKEKEQNAFHHLKDFDMCRNYFCEFIFRPQNYFLQKINPLWKMNMLPVKISNLSKEIFFAADRCRTPGLIAQRSGADPD